MVRFLSAKPWCEALGILKHEPARELLESMLTGDYGPAALQALRRIDPKGHTDRAIGLALNRKAHILARKAALSSFHRRRDEQAARRLVPLLEEITLSRRRPHFSNWRVCDETAGAIALLLGWNKSETSQAWHMGEREELIAKIRRWAKKQGKQSRPSSAP